MAKFNKIPIIVFLLLLVGAIALSLRQSPNKSIISRSSFTMGTLVTITALGSESDLPALEKALGEFSRIHALMTPSKGSPLYKLNEEGGGKADAETLKVVAEGLKWAKLSDGAFSPTLGRLIELWDVTGDPHPPPPQEDILKEKELSDWNKVTIEGDTLTLKGQKIDLGAIAKGYAMDLAAKSLKSSGVDDFIVDAGGNLFVAGSKGPKPWSVGIEHPRLKGQFLAVVAPKEGALVTSGDYERFYLWNGQRLHHIIDPATGWPAKNSISVTIWAKDATTADALSTAVFVLGADKGLKLLESTPDTEGMVVGPDMAVSKTSGFDLVAPTR